MDSAEKIYNENSSESNIDGLEIEIEEDSEILDNGKKKTKGYAGRKVKELTQPLITRQRKWVIAYNSGMSATDAAKVAGYDDDKASQYGSINKYVLQNFCLPRDDNGKVIDVDVRRKDLGSIADVEEALEVITVVMREEGQQSKVRLECAKEILNHNRKQSAIKVEDTDFNFSLNEVDE